MVITPVLHTGGRRFDPGLNHFRSEVSCVYALCRRNHKLPSRRRWNAFEDSRSFVDVMDNVNYSQMPSPDDNVAGGLTGRLRFAAFCGFAHDHHRPHAPPLSVIRWISEWYVSTLIRACHAYHGLITLTRLCSCDAVTRALSFKDLQEVLDTEDRTELVTTTEAISDSPK